MSTASPIQQAAERLGRSTLRGLSIGVDIGFDVDHTAICAAEVHEYRNDTLLVLRVWQLALGTAMRDVAAAVRTEVDNWQQEYGYRLPFTVGVDVSRDPSVLSEFLDAGLGGRQKLYELVGIIFTSAGDESRAQPWMRRVAGGGGTEYVARLHVPKPILFGTLRRKLNDGLVAIDPNEWSTELARQLNAMESRITAARRDIIQPVGDIHDDLADAAVIAVHGVGRLDACKPREPAQRRPAVGAGGWT